MHTRPQRWQRTIAKLLRAAVGGSAWVFGGCLALTPARADVGLSAGAPGGTYYPVAQEIRQVCTSLHLQVYESSGSLSNIERILFDPQVSFGFSQIDALQYYKSHTSATWHQQLRLVLPLYREEIHVVTRDEPAWRQPSDLQGRKVAVGIRSSGNWVTANWLDKLLKLAWLPVEISVQDGLERLRDGDVDAVIVIGGKPYGGLNQVFATTANGQPSPPGFKLLPLNDPALAQNYQAATIPAGTYRWLRQDIPTYAVPSALITRASSNRAPVEHAQHVQSLVRCLQRELPKLQRRGHPKWRDVDFSNYRNLASQWPFHPQALPTPP